MQITEQSRQISFSPLKPPHAHISGPVRQLVELEGIAEQALGQPDTGNATGPAIGVAVCDEGGDCHAALDKGKLPPSSRGTSLSGEITPYGRIPGMISINRNRLRELLEERGTTARAVSRAIGSNDTLVRDILNGKSKNARGDTMAKIADHLGVPVGELMTGVEAMDRVVAEAAELPVIGPIQAGAWLALDETAQDEPVFFTAIADRRYPHARQWLREVRGDSMNAKGIVPGDLAHIVDVTGAGVNLNSGMIVEVTRIRAGGALREITLKEVEVTSDGLKLWPRSTNPRWTDPLTLVDGDDGDIEVQITGLLLQAIKRFL